jgi:hypothetical protein
MRKPHPRALAAKARVREATGAIEASGVERVDVIRRKRIQLGVGIEVLVGPQWSSLWLAVSREPRLVERRADAGPTAESPELWWHGIGRKRLLELAGGWNPRRWIGRDWRRTGRKEGRRKLMSEGRIEVLSSSSRSLM